MHHAHVKRKENLMNRYVLEEFYRMPGLHDRLMRDARRERARALHDATVWLWSRAKAAFTAIARPRPARWIERLG
jgi:hypothetical protein